MTANRLVIEALADSEAALIEQVAAARIDADAYRQLARAALHELHDRHVEVTRLRAALHQLRDEYRALRVQTLRRAAA